MVFIGKSLTARGGQNPIEAGALGKPMVFGPHMQNFESITEMLVQKEGAIQVKNAEDLEVALAKILSDPELAARLGQNAQSVVRENLGAIERTVDMIVHHLDWLAR